MGKAVIRRVVAGAISVASGIHPGSQAMALGKGEHGPVNSGMDQHTIFLNQDRSGQLLHSSGASSVTDGIIPASSYLQLRDLWSELPDLSVGLQAELDVTPKLWRMALDQPSGIHPLLTNCSCLSSSSCSCSACSACGSSCTCSCAPNG